MVLRNYWVNERGNMSNDVYWKIFPTFQNKNKKGSIHIEIDLITQSINDL